MASYINEKSKSFKDLHHEVLKLIELFNAEYHDRFAITSSITAIDQMNHYSNDASKKLAAIGGQKSSRSGSEIAHIYEEMDRGLVKLE